MVTIDRLFHLGNIITLIVLNHRMMRKGGINNLLQGLAISDIVAPTLACLPNVIYYYGPRNHVGLISFLNVYILPIATGATFCSNWIGKILHQFEFLHFSSSSSSSCHNHLFSFNDCD